MIELKKGSIHLRSGSNMRTVAVLNDNYTHIGIDDHCYVIINGANNVAGISNHIFPEAWEALSQLPSNPDEA